MSSLTQWFFQDSALNQAFNNTELPWYRLVYQLVWEGEFVGILPYRLFHEHHLNLTYDVLAMLATGNFDLPIYQRWYPTSRLSLGVRSKVSLVQH